MQEVIPGNWGSLQNFIEDELAYKVFEESLRILGGPRKIVLLQRLTWVSSLLEAALVIVLREIFDKTAEEIAAELGISTNTVRNILRADPERALQYLEEKMKDEEAEAKGVHVAGGLAKKAFEEIRSRLKL